MIQGDSRATGLMCNKHALRWLMIAGPEVARMVKEFEVVANTCECKHHEQTNKKW